jgi:mono/diheme cytochrome c family protein
VKAILALVVIVAGVSWSVAGGLAQPVLGPSQDPLAGSRVFGSKGCATCHAVGGIGGKVGPDLGRIPRPRSFFDLVTGMWNHLPRMTERMQQLGIARPRLDAREAGDLIAFLYTLHYFDPPGDATTGRRLFSEKHCVVCHQVAGSGGVVGPPLDHLKPFGSPIFVAAAMWNHSAQMSVTMQAKGVARPTFSGSELRDLIAFLVPAAATPEGPVYLLPGRVDTGRLLFAEKQCVVCHGAAVRGARAAPDLAGRGVRRTPVEFAAAMWNKAPTMLAAMRQRGIAVPQLRADEMADIVAYLYSIRYLAEPGDLRNGWAVATAKGCLHCHALAGERGKTASDLTRVKGLDSPAAVLAALWNHLVVTAPSPGGQRMPWPEFRPGEMADLVAALQSSGRKR